MEQRQDARLAARRGGGRLVLALGGGLGGLVMAAPASGEIAFTDVTESAGLGYVQHVPMVPPDCLALGTGSCEPDRMSGGAAVADVDGDGWLDLFVSRLGAHDLLFRNRGDGTFEDVSEASGLTAFATHTNGAAFADVDNDGDADLYTTGFAEAGDALGGRNHLFLNDGAGVFTESAEGRGAAVATGDIRIGYSVAVGDYDRDGWVDLHTTEWKPSGVLGLSHARLLHGIGASAPGHFEDVTSAAGVDLGGSYSFASSFADLDDDGWPDLAVAADFGTSRLFWNEGDGSFTEGTASAQVGTDENGMGSTLGDFDADGDLDWFVTSVHDAADTCATLSCGWGATGNRLYRNEGGRLFSDATDAAGVREGFWGWGTVFFDADNDGDLDLVMTNGMDLGQVTIEDAFNDDPMRFWVNDGTGVMSEVSASAGLTDTGSGKGLLVFDFDADGDLDLFLVNNGTAGGRLYRNDSTPASGFVRVRVRGSRGGSQFDGLGARVSVIARPGAPVQVREIGAGSHFLGQSERVAHFGLGAGDAPIHELRVSFPATGHELVFHEALRNQSYQVFEPHPGRCGLVGAELLLAVLLAGAGAGRWWSRLR